MNQLFACLLALFVSTSSPAIERNSDSWRSTLAAKTETEFANLVSESRTKVSSHSRFAG